MAIKFPYTHHIDWLLIVPRIVVWAALLISIILGAIYLIDNIDFSKVGLGTNMNTVLDILAIIFGYLLSRYLYALTFGRIFSTLSTYLYLRIELKTKMSWKDADFVSFLFTPNETGKWYPMDNVLKLPEKDRPKAVLEFAKKVYN